jgi:hypothetical protein
MKPRRRIIVTGAQRPDLDARALANLLIALDEHLNQHHDYNTTTSKETSSEPDAATPSSE